MHRILTTVIVTLGVAALAFAGVSSMSRMWMIGATDIPTMPRARDMVVIDTASYQVPANRRFVLTAIGHRSGVIGVVYIFRDGVRLLRVDKQDPGAMVEFPMGLVFQPGTLVEFSWAGSNPSSALYGNLIAWGYIELDH